MGRTGEEVMRYIKSCFLFLICFFCFSISVSAKDKVTLYLFYGSECPHCADEKEFLKELEKKYSSLEIKLYEVWHNEENEKLMNQVKEVLDKNNPYVPFTVVGENALTGFNSSMENSIESLVKNCMETTCTDIVSKLEKNENVEILGQENNEENIITLPFIGKVKSSMVSLPLLSIILGFVDGFNPCAMWILLFLIGMLIGNHDKKKMILLGSLFLLTSALVYALFMTSWLTIVLSMEQVSILRFFIALVALFGAIWNLYSYYKSTKEEIGCQVVNSSKRKKIMNKIKSFIGEKNIYLACIGIITLAVSVNFIELACSAGWPLIFTEILSFHHLNFFAYAFYIFLYILFYLLDDLIIFLIAVCTFKITGISNKYSKYSHLIGGVLMLLIGVLMLLKPEWLMLNFS